MSHDATVQDALIITPQIRARLHGEIRAGHFQSVHDLLVASRSSDDVYLGMILGMSLAGLGKPVEAAGLLCDFALRNPTLLHPTIELMEIFVGLERRADAKATLVACMELTPEDARLYEAFGALLTQMGQYDEAIAVLRDGLARRPGNLQAMNALAAALNEAGEFAEAEHLFRESLKVDPTNFATLSNLACVLTAAGQLDEALRIYHHSISLRPSDPRVRLNHSIALLKAGYSTQGWLEHEWRLQLPGHTNLPADRLLPNISPSLDLKDKVVLITQEEGLGDTLMYLRYIPCLAKLGAIVHAWVPKTLAEVTSLVEGVAKVQVGGEAGEYDWHCPFISLPRAFTATSTPMGAPVPYLKPDPEKLAFWKDHLPKTKKLRVGIVWGGAPRPTHTISYLLDRRRSASLKKLEPLGLVKGIQLINLQFGPAAAQLSDKSNALDIYDPMGEVTTMADTAAIICNLDVVVSVDTSMVHLAGGLGKKVILMDRFDNCWRWLTGREDSVWYPNLTIVRQSTPQDWDGVALRVAEKLEILASGTKKTRSPKN